MQLIYQIAIFSLQNGDPYWIFNYGCTSLYFTREVPKASRAKSILCDRVKALSNFT